jgi:arabinogalactan oligomer/maltooligosaccharide transport system permease protein
MASSDDGKIVAAVAKRSCVFLSADQGSNWKELRTLPTAKGDVDGDLNWESLDMSADGKTIVVAEEGRRATDKGSVYISADGGSKWVAAKNTDSKWLQAVVSADGKHVYAVARRRSDRVLFHSEDAGSSWNELTSAGIKEWTSLSVSSDGSKVLVSAKDDNVYRSDDFGKKWSVVQALPKAYWTSVRISSDAMKAVAAAENGSVYLTADGGKTWNADAALGIADWKLVTLSGNRVVAAAKEEMVAISDNFGADWKKINIGKGQVVGSVVASAGLTSSIVGIDFGYIIKTDGIKKETITGYSNMIHYFDNYIKAFTKYDVPKWLVNSLIVSILSTIFAVLLAITAGYAFSRYVFKGREVGLSLLFVTQMFPITMLLIPLYLMLSKLGLINGYSGLIIIYTATNIPFCIWMIKGYCDTIPKSLEESAYLDGCNAWQAFRYIMLPLMTPVIALSALFGFMGSWSEYLVANAVLKNASLKTLPIGLVSLQGEFSTEWGVYSAIALVTALPVMIVFISLSKYLVGGLSAGAVKG